MIQEEIDRIENSLPMPESFGIGDSDYNSKKVRIEELKKMQQFKRDWRFLLIPGVTVCLWISAFVMDIEFLVPFAYIGLYISLMTPSLLSSEATPEHKEVVRLEREISEIDRKYSKAVSDLIHKNLIGYQSTHLYKKRSDSPVFSQHFHVYKELVSYFKKYYHIGFSEHDTYISTRSGGVRTSTTRVQSRNAPIHRGVYTERQMSFVTPEIQNIVTRELEQMPEQKPAWKNVKEKQYIDFQKPQQTDSNENLQNIGRTGESIALMYETGFLIKNGRRDLADKVIHTSVVQGDGAGYDIESYFLDGRKKYIEVKSSPSENTIINMSANELSFLQGNLENSFLYTVSFIYSNPKIKTYSATLFRNTDKFAVTKYRASISSL
jgi:Domain of unknown function (DUF3883)